MDRNKYLIRWLVTYKNKTYIDEITKEDFLQHYGANLV